MLNIVDTQEWGGTITIDCPYQPAGSYRDGINVRWSLLSLRESIVIIQRIMNDAIFSVDPTTYSLTINNLTPLLHGDYRCILSYDIDNVYDSTVNRDYTDAPVVPVRVAGQGSSGMDIVYYY